MLKCPKCGTDNLLSAIFCRGCGERMDLDALKPEDFEDTGMQKKGNDLANRIAAYILLVLLVGAIVGFFCPAFGTFSPEDVSSSVQENYKKLVDGQATGAGVSFSSQEATDILNSRLETFDGEEGSPSIKAISVEFMDDDPHVRVVVSARIGGFLPFSVTILGNVSTTSSLRLNASSIKAGLFPVPQDAQDSLIENFKTVMESVMREANHDMDSCTVSADRITIVQSK